MVKKIGAVSIGVAIGLVIAFARAGAFPFWDTPKSQPSASAQASQKDTQSAQNTQSAQIPRAAASPAPANQPEPGERPAVLTSFAPLVKRVMPTVVNVAVVQDVKVQGFGGG